MAAPAPTRNPFLVLYFDVNKTIVMSDACQGRSVSRVVGEVLGSALHGTVDAAGSWAWNGKPPTTLPMLEGQVSYKAWLRRQTQPDEERNSWLDSLGQRECSIADVAPVRECMEEALRLPNGELGNSYRALFDQDSFPATQPWRYVVPAFFSLVQTLSKRGRRFSVVFRTFGTDIGNGLCQEVNAFAEGRHPLYPDTGRFDGTGGRPDLRISLDDPSSHGSFYRDEEGVHLVLGTLERPPPDNDVSEVGLRHYEGSGLRILHGHEAVSAEIMRLTSERGLIALRDYWPWWGKVQGEKAEAGKPLYLDLKCEQMHPIFFDDNVARNEAHIVDVRDLAGNPLPFSAVAGTHVIRSEPLECLSDPDYFVKCIDAAEQRRRRQLGEEEQPLGDGRT